MIAIPGKNLDPKWNWHQRVMSLETLQATKKDSCMMHSPSSRQQDNEKKLD
jgi:hypothetical protein